MESRRDGTDDALERVVRALSRFQSYRNAELAAAARAVDALRAAQLNRFDLFRIAGVRVNENQFTNALVALLDPRAEHGLGTAPFIALLKRLRHPVAERIAHEVMEGVHYSVRPQRSYDETTPDICVFADTFVVLVEHKVRRGRETVTAGGKQTVRQASLLRRIAAERAIPRATALGVLLSPEGTAPAASSFVPLRTGELLEELRTVVGMATVEGARKMDAFLELWEGFNV